MPYRRSRKYKRKRKKKQWIPNVIRYQGPLKKTQKSTLTYSDIYTMTNGVGTMSSQIMRLNGPFDPDVTGAGHQPRGFDQLMALYDHYVVIGAQIELNITNWTDSAACTFAACIKDNNLADTNYLSMLENATRRVVTLSKATAGGASKRLTFNINPNKFLGRSKPLSDPELKGGIGSVPDEQAFLHFGHTASDLTSVATITVNATIKYTIVFIEPKTPSES